MESEDFIREWEFPVLVNKIAGAPATCLFFGSYENFKRILPVTFGLKSEFLTNFCSGFLAECVSCVFWVPIDVIKERL